jgi:hypothetical protein
MTFRIHPRPPRDSCPYQQAVELKRTLERGGWALALAEGRTPKHILLLSVMWAIAWSAQNTTTSLEFDGHVLEWSWTPRRRYRCKVDGMPTSVTPAALTLMLIDQPK